MPVSSLLIGMRGTEQSAFFALGRDQLQTVRQFTFAHTAGQAESGQSCKRPRDGVQVAQV